MDKGIKLKYRENEVPEKKSEMIVLSLQHVFAMFGSTVLVPFLIGIDASIALFCAGLGTLIYSQVTSKKVPVFIGSSFAYIATLTVLNQQYGPSGVAMGVMSVGIIYILIALLIKFIGTSWVDKILPPVVIGPVIIVIGLSLASTAVLNSGFGLTFQNEVFQTTQFAALIVALTTFLTTAFVMIKGGKKIKAVPIIIGIAVGYLTAILADIIFGVDLVDTSQIFANGLLSLPAFQIPFVSYDPSFNLDIFLLVLPIAVVTITEHIGDHSVSSSIVNKNFLKDPGLSRTILGDGLATLTAGLLGGPVNTTYSENTGVIVLTGVASVRVIRLAAMFAMALAFITPVREFINSIPPCVMGGISLILFGLIAQNGIRIMINSKVDITEARNMIIVGTILVLGLGYAGISFTVGSVAFSFAGMSLATIFGIILNLIFSEKKTEKEKTKE